MAVGARPTSGDPQSKNCRVVVCLTTLSVCILLTALRKSQSPEFEGRNLHHPILVVRVLECCK